MTPKLRPLLSLAVALLAIGLLTWHYCFRSYASIPGIYGGATHAEVEERLRPLAQPKRAPRQGDWLHAYPEAGQSFETYINSQPVRRDAQRRAIYLCLVGDFTPTQLRILEITQEYMALVFQCPVTILKRESLDSIPSSAQRRHPSEGQLQLLTSHFLYDSLIADRPDDALAYVAFTSADLWTKDPDGRDWNYVFGQADLKNRLGVWSLARFGNPESSPESFAKCLKLTLGTATHETGHILGMLHCVYFQCNMNGANNLDEARRTPLPFCPICLRKLCWNLKVDPELYLRKLLEFSAKHHLAESVTWYESALAAIKR